MQVSTQVRLDFGSEAVPSVPLAVYPKETPKTAQRNEVGKGTKGVADFARCVPVGNTQGHQRGRLKVRGIGAVWEGLLQHTSSEISANKLRE